MKVRVSRTVLAMATLVAVAASPAAGEDWYDLNRTEREDGSSIVKLGVRLPSSWNPRIGLDMGAAAAPQDRSDLARARLRALDDRSLFDPAPEYRRPASAAWGSVAMPGTRRFLGFETASVNVRVDPEQETANLRAALARSWTFREAITATVRNEYTLAHRGLGLSNMETSDVVRANRSVRLEAIDLRTTLFVRENWNSNEQEWKRAVGAEHRLGGGISLSGTIENPRAEDPDYNLRAGWRRRW